MRQIENQWRFDPTQPVLFEESKRKFLAKYKFSTRDLFDVSTFSEAKQKSYYRSQCVDVCLNREDAAEDCLKKCQSKLEKSTNLYENIRSEFEEKIQTFNKAGVDYFKY